MRADMKDLIIDVVRHKGYERKGRVYRGPVEDAPSKEPMKILGGKSFSDRLSPVVESLKKSAGRQWDKIWSEICENNDHREVRGRHLRNHILEYVDRKAKLDENGKYIPKRRYGWARPFWVHPKTGRLHVTKQKARPRYEQPPVDFVTLSPLVQARRIDGIWYEVTFEKFIPGSVIQDVLTGALYGGVPVIYADMNPVIRLRKLYGIAACPIKKRQLNSKEIKRLKLRDISE